MVSRIKARELLAECNGLDIWSVDHCRARGIPEAWIEELADCFESGFDHPGHTIHTDQGLTNQYHGIHDLDLALRLAELLGVETSFIVATVFGRQAQVRALKDAVDEV